MPIKILWIDTETTGLDASRHGLIEIACLIEIDGEIKEEFSTKVRPFKGDLLAADALKITGTTKEQLETFPTPEEVYAIICSMFGKYVDKYDKTDKFIPGGFNVVFDLDFLTRFFEKNNDVYIGSWLDRRRPLDPRYLLSIMDYCGQIKLPNYKLETACAHYGIEINNHQALSDIKASRALFKKIMEQVTFSTTQS